ncbi:MAG TPA: OpgC domain-containing protein [Hyphomicrobiales bacterium]|nr:OpgC domain-containing protein [Hyphomicrobiales bacterium]
MQENSSAPLNKRDPRLDFFRGVAMFLILIAHTPGNWWVNWIPARLGFSDAAEIFVFCSGMASAIAFGKIFEQQGMLMGTARIMHRVWQVYWTHIALFFAVVTELILIDKWLSPVEHAYSGTYNLAIFFENIRDCIFGLLTLTYVPNYWDILPMYLVILALVPIVMLLRRLNPYAPFVFMATLWALAGLRYLDLPAEPWSDRRWFFNPFAWQLLFFTGFAFIRGWLPKPPIRKDWMIVAVIVIIASIPLSQHYLLWDIKPIQDIRQWLQPVITKTEFGLFRYLHFLALAYLGYSIATRLGDRMSGLVVDLARKVGQQSLAVFASSLFIAQILGTLVHLVGVNNFSVFIMNMVGFASLIGVAYVVSWFKSTPWKKHMHHPSASGALHIHQHHRDLEEKREEDTDNYARQYGAPTASPAE